MKTLKKNFLFKFRASHYEFMHTIFGPTSETCCPYIYSDRGSLVFYPDFDTKESKYLYWDKEQNMTVVRIELGDITKHNIKLMRRLNQFIFPVNYNDKFYKDVLEAGELAKLAFYNDVVVGAVCCRVEQVDNERRLYIMTLGCLYRYRRLGIGTTMLEHVLECASNKGIDNIYLHVQINNTGAIEFYKKFGFEIVDTKEGYYKKIEPSSALVLKKKL